MELQPLVSVIIPSYNHAHYLVKAIQSVLSQSYQNFEIIVVDDGSTDNTKYIVKRYPFVKYHYQTNMGLSAARNAGIKSSQGSLMVFLDADDWLLPDALAINIEHLKHNSEAAFVSGAHELYSEQAQKSWLMQQELDKKPYHRLLEGNYIGMHATVMYQRWLFDKFQFDTVLKYCEDYDLYLKTARIFLIIHHTEPIAVYRIHTSNMSGDISGMLQSVLSVLNKQSSFSLSPIEKQYLNMGLMNWKTYYTEKIYNTLSSHFAQKQLNEKETKMLRLYNPSLYAKLIQERKAFITKIKLKRNVAFIKNIFRRLKSRVIALKDLHKNYTIATGKVNLGNFNRTTPFSIRFGYDRGGPIDRYYIEKFLQNNSKLIKGRILEIGDNEYTLKYGDVKNMQSDILHINEKNPKATFIGDLTDAPHLPSNSFDCIILTQTLQFIYDYRAAVQTCYRILKPGGTLLLTVPGISHIAQDEWGELWHWSFTAQSITKILSEYFPLKNMEIETFGNVLVAAAFLFGMGLPEITQKQLDEHDPHFQVIIAAQSFKPR